MSRLFLFIIIIGSICGQPRRVSRTTISHTVSDEYDKFIDDVALLVVKIKNCYPFKSPEVIFNEQNVISYYSKLTQILSTYTDFEKLTGKRCLCCCSVVCGNNWSVTNRIMDIKKGDNKYEVR